MRRKYFIIGLIVTIVLCCFVSTYGYVENKKANFMIQDKSACIIVKYTSENFTPILLNGIRTRENLTNTIELIELENPADMLNIIQNIETVEGVEFVQRNYVLKASEVTDKAYSMQWGLENTTSDNAIDINVAGAWKITQGSSEVVVGVLDSGIDLQHPELKNTVCGYGYNFVDNNNEIYDEETEKHGTGIAGIIAAQANEDGIRGIASGVKIAPLKFLQNYEGYTSDAIKAIKYAEKHEIKIVNCSFEGKERNPALESVMKNSDILFICSAGNGGKDVSDMPSYPACFDLPNIISVGSVNADGKISDFSNYGTQIDVLAPGENVYSTIPGGKYYSFNGTSMSAAHVAGIAALLKSQSPDISGVEIANRIISTAKKYVDYEGVVGSSGIVDAHAALINIPSPASEERLFKISNDVFARSAQVVDNAMTESNGTELEALDMELSTTESNSVFSEAGEIRPVVAQQLHYGESGINPASGNFSFSVTDFEDDTPEGKFTFTRYYNSCDQRKETYFGRGWSSALDSKIYNESGRESELPVIMPNGSTHVFTMSDGKYSSETTRNSLIQDSSGQFIMTTPLQEKYIFGKVRRGYYKLTKILDKTDSTVMQIEYSDNRLLTPSYIIDSVGRKYSIAYDNLQIKSITDPYGRIVRYTYGYAEGSLVFLHVSIDSMGNKTIMDYIPKDFHIVGFEFADTDLFMDSIDYIPAGGNLRGLLRIEYNIRSYEHDYGKVKSFTDAYGETYTYTYNYMYTTIERQNKEEFREEYYDSYMYTYKTVLNENTTKATERRYYRPDGKNYGEVVQERCTDTSDITTYIREPNTGNILRIVNPDGSSKSFWYDDNNNMVGTTDEENNCTLYVYNANNRMIQKASYLTKGFPAIADKTQIPSYIAQHLDQFIIENYTYVNGSKYNCLYSQLLESITDAEGNIISYTYDKFGNLLTSSQPHQSGERVLNERYEYYVTYVDTGNTSAGAQTKAYVEFLNSNTQSNFYVLGMEKRTFSPMGVLIANFTDNNGLCYKTVRKDGTIEEISRTVYDVQGRKVKEITPQAYVANNCSTSEKISNKNVSVSSKIHYTYYYLDFGSSTPCTYATEYKYIDEFGAGYNEVETITYPMINGNRAARSFQYEKNNIIWETDPNGRDYESSYDSLDRKKYTYAYFIGTNTGKRHSVKLESSSLHVPTRTHVLRRDVDTVGSFVLNSQKKNQRVYSIESILDYRGNPVNTELDIKDKNPSVQTNVYNRNGTLSKEYNSNGNIIYYVYDNLKRVVEQWEAVDIYDGFNYYRYSKKDYYKNGKLKTEYVCTQPVKIPLDANENVLPGNEQYRSLYKKDGQQTQQSDYVVKEYTYYSNGKVKSISQNNGALTEYQYDNDGNVTVEIVNGAKNVYSNGYFGKPIVKREYVTLESLNLGSEDKYTLEGDYAVLTTEYQYQYGNLIKVVYPNGLSVTYEYDEMGRQTASSQSGNFVNENGATVNGIIRKAQKFDWDNSLLEETVEEIVGGKTNLITKNVHTKSNATVYYGYNNSYYLILEKVESTQYENNNPVDTKTSLYYKDLLDRVIISVSPENYISDGVVSYTTLYQDTFSDDPKEMNRTEYEYDALGRLVREIERYRDPNSNNEWKMVVKSSYSYDTNNNVVETVDAMGNSTKYVYNLDNKVYLEKDPIAQDNNYSYSKKYTYDALGRTLTETNRAKHDTVYTYNDALNTVTTSDAATNPSGVLETIIKHSKYDNSGNLLEEYVDTPNRKYTYNYNERGQLIQATTPSDETVPSAQSVMKYDVMGNMSERTIGTERLELYAYDSFGNNISSTVSKIDGSDAVTTSKSYDSRGNVRFEKDGNQNVIEHKYDGFNRVIETIAVKPMYYTYDDNDNQIQQTDWRGNTVTFIYDPLNRLIQKTDASGVAVEKLFYNDNNAQIKSIDGLGQVTVFEYDKNNRLLSTTDPLSHKTGQTYNRAGLVASKYDGNGNLTAYEYDELGRMIQSKQMVDGVEEIAAYTYDKFGNILTQTNGEGHTTSFTYNVMNKVAAKIDHDGWDNEAKTETYKYDERGNLTERTDRNGNTLKYVFDVHNRLSETRQEDKLLVKQTYDANGNQLTMQDESGLTTRTYDSLNRVVSKEVPVIGKTTYQYDITSGLENGYVSEKMTDSKGNTTVKVYDRNNRLYQVKDGAQTASATYKYYANGAQMMVTAPDGSSSLFAYYADGTLASLSNVDSAGKIIDNYTYTYDAAKNQLTKNEIISGVNKGKTTFTYDTVNRLKTVTEPTNRCTEYTYDRAGNRKTESVTENGLTAVTTYNYNEQERLTSTDLTVGDVTKIVKYNYDNNGNLYSKMQSVIAPDNEAESQVSLSQLGIDAEPGDAAIYEYNVFNQLVKVSQGSNIITNVYNGEGLRVSKNVNGDTCHYLYEYDKIVLETDDSGSQTARNIYGTSLISRESDGKRFTYHYNGHGDVTSLTDTSGKIAASYTYDPFGVELESTGDVSNPFRYAGYEFDDETELYYLKSRFYDASIARFVQEDTYWNPDNMIYGDRTDDNLAPDQTAIAQSGNLYVYSMSNPLLYYDPTGYKGKLLVFVHGLNGDANTFKDTVANLKNEYNRNGDTQYLSIGIITAGRGNNSGDYYTGSDKAGIYYNYEYLNELEWNYGKNALNNKDAYLPREISVLTDQDINVMLRLEFSSGVLSFEDQKNEFADMMKKVEGHDADVTFIGHSMGGLASINYGMDYQKAHSNKNVSIITVDTPYHPNWYAENAYRFPAIAEGFKQNVGEANRDLGGLPDENGNYALAQLRDSWNSYKNSGGAINLYAINTSMYNPEEEKHWSDKGDGIVDIPSQTGSSSKENWGYTGVNVQATITGSGKGNWTPMQDAMDMSNPYSHVNITSRREVAKQIHNIIK